MNTIAIKIGAMYLIMMRHAARQRNFDEAMISSSMIFGLMHQPTKIQVRNATIGIMMVFGANPEKLFWKNFSDTNLQQLNDFTNVRS